MVGQRILVPSTGVRLSQSQPFAACLTIAYVARSSSGSGRRPLKAEITSSNLVRATKWPVRLAVQDAALSRRRSPVRIWYGLPNVQGRRLRVPALFRVRAGAWLGKAGRLCFHNPGICRARMLARCSRSIERQRSTGGGACCTVHRFGQVRDNLCPARALW